MAAYLGIGLLIPDGHPKTVRFVIDNWSNSSWGFHRIRRTVSTCEVSVAADGSRNNDCENRGFRHFLIPEEKPARERQLYLRIGARSGKALSPAIGSSPTQLIPPKTAGARSRR
jgi:hypothetical protein